jgi:hypothetical protein
MKTHSNVEGAWLAWSFRLVGRLQAMGPGDAVTVDDWRELPLEGGLVLDRKPEPSLRLEKFAGCWLITVDEDARSLTADERLVLFSDGWVPDSDGTYTSIAGKEPWVVAQVTFFAKAALRLGAPPLAVPAPS